MEMKIRPFEPEDAAAVASLWQYWFRDKTRTPAPGMKELVTRLYVENPNSDPTIPSLVAEGGNGTMLGFLGVTVTPVRVDSAPGSLACVFPSVVDPDAPTTVASFLLRKFLTGPQVFTISDGGNVKFERIWETLGGAIGQLQSLRWVKLLRPFELGAGIVTQRRGLRPWGPVVAPVARGGDLLARRVARGRLRTTPSSWKGEPLSPEALIEANATLHRNARLRPDYHPEYLRWLFAEMTDIREQGSFRATLVRDDRGAVAGWYAYYLQPGGVGRVFALEAHERRLDGVIDHLFAEADAGGAGALIGRLEPRLRRPMSARGCLVHAGGSLQMLHARDRSLVDDALLGRLAFSRLEGENWYWWRIVSKTIV
jgi:hypothetical protein